MIIGAHVILYSRDAEADRRFFRDVLGLSHVDAGDGWLIFALPPTEIAAHPAEDDTQRELYLLTDDLADTLTLLKACGIAHEPITEARWGILSHLTLPGGGRLGLYQPKHPLAIQPATS
jgi:catechol 2,3-dioxygenase-like lactoylglutathione lyase family enzyme